MRLCLIWACQNYKFVEIQEIPKTYFDQVCKAARSDFQEVRLQPQLIIDFLVLKCVYGLFKAHIPTDLGLIMAFGSILKQEEKEQALGEVMDHMLASLFHVLSDGTGRNLVLANILKPFMPHHTFKHDPAAEVYWNERVLRKASHITALKKWAKCVKEFWI
jgi:hypothetical protein